MTTRRIDLRPDIRPGTRNWGATPMLYNSKVIGSSDQPEYAAARWLLDNNAALPTDRLETYRDGKLCMSGIAGKLAKRTVVENDHGNTAVELRRYRPFPTSTVRSLAAASLVHPVPEPPEAVQ